MIGKRFRSLPFIFANDNYTLSPQFIITVQPRRSKNHASTLFPPAQPDSRTVTVYFLVF